MNQQRILAVEPYRALIVAAVILLLTVAASALVQAQTYKELYSFAVTGDPENPQNTGQITQGRDGNLSGATAVGGSFGEGAAFNFTPSGALKVIASFNNPAGVSPYGGLTLGTDGNFYGTTEAGGIGYGTLFKLTSTGTLTTLYNFGTCAYPCKEGAFPRPPRSRVPMAIIMGR